jgi:hypothetical protein
MKETIEISYKNLKQNYIEVQQFLEEKSAEKNICNKSKIANDLNLWGDDNYYALNDFITKYNLDFNNFNYDNHFESEGELRMNIFGVLSVIFIPLYILKAIIGYFSKSFSGKYSIRINNFNFFLKKYKSDRIDLTMGDLITSKIYGKFELRENVQFITSKI